MAQLFASLARIAASKIVGALIALGVSIGVVIPLDESSAVTAALTLAIAAVLQLAWQVVMTWAEQRWPNIRNLQPLVLRVLVRKPRQPVIESAPRFRRLRDFL
jgi:hypothetical protein